MTALRVLVPGLHDPGPLHPAAPVPAAPFPSGLLGGGLRPGLVVGGARAGGLPAAGRLVGGPRAGGPLAGGRHAGGLRAGGVRAGGVHPALLGRVRSGPVLPAAVRDSVSRVGWLESPWLAAGLLAAAVALAAGWAVLAVRGRRAGRRPAHPALRRLGLGTLVAAVALAGVGVAANAYAGYAPDVTALRREVPSLVGVGRSDAGAGPTRLAGFPGSGPSVTDVVLADPADRIPPARVWVYLPAGYDDPADAGRRYPVVYLIHGYPSAAYDWFGAGRAGTTAALLERRGLVRPMILVAPDASGGTLRDTECLDSTTGGPRLETFLTRTLVRFVDSRYRTIPDRAGRAIGGLSAGGYCALNLGFRHQREYAAVLGMEPYGDPGRTAVRGELGGSAALAAANSPGVYAATMPLVDPQRVFLATARDDRETRPFTERIAGRLAARGLDVTLSEATSLGHSWREGRAELPYALLAASAALTGPTAPTAPGPATRPGPGAERG
jgi:enterochelin esterase-like enzyme